MEPVVSEQHLADAHTLWDYHHMGHQQRPTDVGIGLGSHDLDVATHAASMYKAGMFPLVVFTGANAPTTIDLFPRGEATHYAERAVELGVPVDRVLIEPDATNTGENITFTRGLLRDHDVQPSSVTLISRPYQQRRAYATCRKMWPEVDVVCTSRPTGFRHYLATIGDTPKVISMLVGDTQRIDVHAKNGFAIPQTLPTEVRLAYDRLVRSGFTARLL